MGTGADWIWVLDGSVAPSSGALRVLMEAVRGLGSGDQPALLAGVTLDRRGAVDPSRAAWYRRAPTEAALEAAELGLLPIRAAAGSVLVSRRAALAEGGPRPGLALPGAMLEWTARLLRTRKGYWVPESTGETLSPAPVDRSSACAVLAGAAFAGADRLRAALTLAGQAKAPLT